MAHPEGELLIIGGREEKRPDEICDILEIVARRCRGGQLLLLVTSASNIPHAVAEMYYEIMPHLGVHNMLYLDVRDTGEAHNPSYVELVHQAEVVFMPGGSQFRLAQTLCDTPLMEAMRANYRAGKLIAGTSAGATAMSELMISEGYSGQSHRHGSLELARGLGLLPGTIIDTHFAQRGRLGRLLGAIAEEPDELGLGLDENTAMLVTEGHIIEVLGRGALTVLDGAGMEFHTPAISEPTEIVSFTNVRLDVLAHGDRYDLATRTPLLRVAVGPHSA